MVLMCHEREEEGGMCKSRAAYTFDGMTFCEKHKYRIEKYNKTIASLKRLDGLSDAVLPYDIEFEEKIKQEIRKGGGKLVINYKTKEIRRVK